MMFVLCAGWVAKASALEAEARVRDAVPPVFLEENIVAKGPFHVTEHRAFTVQRQL